MGAMVGEVCYAAMPVVRRVGGWGGCVVACWDARVSGVVGARLSTGHPSDGGCWFKGGGGEGRCGWVAAGAGAGADWPLPVPDVRPLAVWVAVGALRPSVGAAGGGRRIVPWGV